MSWVDAIAFFSITVDFELPTLVISLSGIEKMLKGSPPEHVKQIYLVINLSKSMLQERLSQGIDGIASLGCSTTSKPLGSEFHFQKLVVLIIHDVWGKKWMVTQLGIQVPMLKRKEYRPGKHREIEKCSTSTFSGGVRATRAR